MCLNFVAPVGFSGYEIECLGPQYCAFGCSACAPGHVALAYKTGVRASVLNCTACSQSPHRPHRLLDLFIAFQHLRFFLLLSMVFCWIVMVCYRFCSKVSAIYAFGTFRIRLQHDTGSILVEPGYPGCSCGLSQGTLDVLVIYSLFFYFQSNRSNKSQLKILKATPSAAGRPYFDFS